MPNARSPARIAKGCAAALCMGGAVLGLMHLTGSSTSEEKPVVASPEYYEQVRAFSHSADCSLTAYFRCIPLHRLSVIRPLRTKTFICTQHRESLLFGVCVCVCAVLSPCVLPLYDPHPSSFFPSSTVPAPLLSRFQSRSHV